MVIKKAFYVIKLKRLAIVTPNAWENLDTVPPFILRKILGKKLREPLCIITEYTFDKSFFLHQFYTTAQKRSLMLTYGVRIPTPFIKN